MCLRGEEQFKVARLSNQPSATKNKHMNIKKKQNTKTRTHRKKREKMDHLDMKASKAWGFGREGSRTAGAARREEPPVMTSYCRDRRWEREGESAYVSDRAREEGSKNTNTQRERAHTKRRDSQLLKRRHQQFMTLLTSHPLILTLASTPRAHTHSCVTVLLLYNTYDDGCNRRLGSQKWTKLQWRWMRAENVHEWMTAFIHSPVSLHTLPLFRRAARVAKETITPFSTVSVRMNASEGRRVLLKIKIKINRRRKWKLRELGTERKFKKNNKK